MKVLGCLWTHGSFVSNVLTRYWIQHTCMNVLISL